MALGSNRVVRVKEEILSDGHNVHYKMILSNLASLRVWPFEKNYCTSCQTLPTAWKYEMRLHEMALDGSITFSFYLKRCDTINAPLFRTLLWMSITDTNGTPIYPPTVFQKNSINPGEEVLEIVKTSAPLFDFGTFLNQEVVLTVSIMVRLCHVQR
ncbi:hypothetical protein HNY73_005893 [Argiope bruennichi]|uniref:Uncharacterized protein n=1 Tax=Argiope bruennichi TaxID=94029 RepID=A0A8T0FI70_ARGBR|nr:hypothetical protein HNY73_005893 [Argiope bruennichi]